MSATTKEQPETSAKKITKSEFLRRLRAARARNRELADQNKLPDPTKSWSNDSLKSLTEALSK